MFRSFSNTLFWQVTGLKCEYGNLCVIPSAHKRPFCIQSNFQTKCCRQTLNLTIKRIWFALVQSLKYCLHLHYLKLYQFVMFSSLWFLATPQRVWWSRHTVCWWKKTTTNLQLSFICCKYRFQLQWHHSQDIGHVLHTPISGFMLKVQINVFKHYLKG